MDLTLRRRFFAEEVEAVANLRTTALVEALAAVPREAFLPTGPWMVVGQEGLGAARLTADADPARVYHCLAVAIDAARKIFNGGPATLGQAIDALALRPGEHVVHVGCGLGYYTALLAHCVGPGGRVTAVEIEASLAAGAARNLAGWPWVEVRQGDGRALGALACDALLVNAGVTHLLDQWLDSLTPAGRMVVPITAGFGSDGVIGKGPLLLVQGAAHGWSVRLLTLVAIYSAVGLRDETLAAQIAAALTSNPLPPLQRLRRDRHAPSPSCWLHGPTSCLSLEAAGPS